MIFGPAFAQPDIVVGILHFAQVSAETAIPNRLKLEAFMSLWLFFPSNPRAVTVKEPNYIKHPNKTNTG